MKSRWIDQVIAMIGKEWRTEVRSRHGVMTSALFSILTVVTMALAGSTSLPAPGLAAGIVCTVLLFASIISVPRTFIVEDEQGTFDLLNLLCHPSAAFFGKMLVGLVPTLLSGILMTTVYVEMAGIPVERPLILALGALLTCTSLGTAISLCGALVVGASNKWVLAGVAAMPLLVPTVFLSVGALRVAFGEGSLGSAYQSLIGLAGLTVCWGALGPLLTSIVWPRGSVPTPPPPVE